MTITETRAPLCRYCAAPIAKHAVKVHFLTGPRHVNLVDSKYERFMSVGERPRDIETVRNMLPDLVVLTVRDHKSGDGIAKAYGWDGHSFVDLYFCNGKHAKEFGYTAAISGMSSIVYQNAMKQRYPAAAAGVPAKDTA